MYERKARSFFPTQLENSFKILSEKISNSEKILLISHRGPDGDTVGCNIALRLSLIELSKQVISACCDPIPTTLHYLPHSKRFKQNFEPSNFDLIIAIDCGSSQMMNYSSKDFNSTYLVNIDHHPSNNNFGNLNIVFPTAAATATIIYHLLNYLQIRITPDIATAIMTGFYFDTGSFMHPNTDQEIFSICADLTSKGANFKTIAKNLFHTQSVHQLKLWGQILNKIKISEKKVVVSMISDEELLELQVTREELNGVIDYLNMVPEGKFSLLLSEDRQGNIKASCRTQKDNIDLSKLAQLFGGGGHKKAAGFSLRGRLKDDLIT